MSRSEHAARALAISAAVALAVGIHAMVPYLHAERWTPVVLESPATESNPIPVALHFQDGSASSVYLLADATPLADILSLAGLEPADPEHPVVIAIQGDYRFDQPQRVDINHAAAWLLQALPGIGAQKARAIVEFRDSHGPFASSDELALVPGIGPATCAALQDFITVTP